jgi:hypothetical protein
MRLLMRFSEFNKKQRQIIRKGNRLLGQLDRDGRLSIQIWPGDSTWLTTVYVPLFQIWENLVIHEFIELRGSIRISTMNGRATQEISSITEPKFSNKCAFGFWMLFFEGWSGRRTRLPKRNLRDLPFGSCSVWWFRWTLDIGYWSTVKASWWRWLIPLNSQLLGVKPQFYHSPSPSPILPLCMFYIH